MQYFKATREGDFLYHVTNNKKQVGTYPYIVQKIANFNEILILIECNVFSSVYQSTRLTISCRVIKLLSTTTNDVNNVCKTMRIVFITYAISVNKILISTECFAIKNLTT